jgi:hypothetical protein
MLDAPYDVISHLLTPKGGVLNITSGSFLIIGSSLSLAEISAAALLVAPPPRDGAPDLSPSYRLSCSEPLKSEPL